jgi:hypothetical protein
MVIVIVLSVLAIICSVASISVSVRTWRVCSKGTRHEKGRGK